MQNRLAITSAPGSRAGAERRKALINRIIGTIRRTQGASGFDGYLENLQRLDRRGAPTREQARRDYLALHRRGRYNQDGIY